MLCIFLRERPDDADPQARPGTKAPAPLSWDRIERGIDTGELTLRTPIEILEKEATAWKGFFRRGPSLSAPPPGASGG